MKKLLLAAASLATFSGSVLAADLPSRKEPIAAPPSPPMWTGLYAGLNAGGTWANNNNVHIVQIPAWINPNTTAHEGTAIVMAGNSAGGGGTVIMPNNGSFIGGAQIGYNESVGGLAVIGAETDIQGIIGNNTNSSLFDNFQYNYPSQALNRVNTSHVLELFTAAKNLTFLGTVRGRVGYLVMPSTMVYLTGGLAYGGYTVNTFGNSQHANSLSEEIGPGYASVSGVKLGWTAGGGAEWMFAENWSAKAEYLYYSLSSVAFSMGPDASHMSVAGAGLSAGQVICVYNFRANTNFNGNIVRAGVNYHFNFASAPVVAKF